MTVRKLKCVVLAVVASAFGAAFGDIISPVESAAENTAAIQAAIDAAGTGGTVELGKGTFEIDEQLMVTNGVTLVGQGWEQTILKQTKSGSSKRCVTVDNGAKVQGVTLTGGKLTGNWNSGGGASVKNGTISWCCISNNAAGGNNIWGGGVYIENNGTCTVDHSIVVGNELTGMSGTGGGIGANNPSATVVIDSCLVCGNTAPNRGNDGGKGGGIGFSGSNPNVTIRNTTIVGNSVVRTGGGLYFPGSKIKLVNTIVSENTADAEDGVANVAGTPATGSSNNIIDDDPMFVDAENGDYHLAKGSPAIGKGVAYDGMGDDLDGNAFATVPSIGCYERMTADPMFAPTVTRFYPSTEVTLTCATDGATIYYTTDGSAPSVASKVYEGPIALTETTTIKAFAVKVGMDPSPIVAAVYTNPGPPQPGRLGAFAHMVKFTVTRDVDGAADGMPVLVKLSEGNPVGFKYADCDPTQMRFGDMDFDVIPFEVDTWNPNGESLVWVKVPLVKDTEINFAYDGTATVENDPAAVWDNYTGVWHLNDLAAEPDTSLTRSQGVYPNSTAVESIDGHLSIDSIANEKGRFGKSFRVNDWTALQTKSGPGGVWVKDGGANSPLDADGTFTISGWFKHQDWNYHWDHVFYKRTASSGTGAFAIENNNSGASNAFAIRGGDNTSAAVTLASMRNSWSYLTFVYEGKKCAVYQDGALVASVSISKATDNNDPLVFGNNINIAKQETGDACWQGWIDEVRFAKGAKNAAFIAAEYAAMTADDLLAAGEVNEVGPEVMVASPMLFPASGTAFYPTTNVTISCLTEGATIRYTLDGSDPTEESAAYGGEIVLSEETTTVRARAFKDGLEPSVVAVATYEYTEPIPPEFGTVTVKPRMKNATFSGMIESVGNLYATACDVYLAIGTSEDDLGEAERVVMGVTDSFKYKVAGLEGGATYYYALAISNNAVFATGVMTSGSFTTPKSDIIEPEATPALTRAALQEAIDDAAEEAAGGTVTLSEGLFEIDDQLIVCGGVTLVGQGWTNTVIKQAAKAVNDCELRCVTVRDGSALVGVTLTGGKIGKQWRDGAGVLVEDGTVSWCCVSNNATAQPAGNNNYGGGIGISKGTVDHTIIAYNTSAAEGSSSHGGGIGVNGPTGPIVIDTCLIVGNKAPNGNGGGIYANMGGQKLTVRNTTIVSNNASETGGAYVSAGKGNFVLCNSILADNMSEKGDVNLALSAGDIVAQAFGNVFANGTAALGEGSASYPGSGAAWFVDEANGDCHLRASAPASDSGVWYDGIVDDLDGIARKEEKMSSGCYECTEVDHGVIKLSPIDVATTTTSATASGSILSLGEGASATVTLRVGTSFEEMSEADTVTDIVTDFALTASGLTHATHYVYEVTVENDVGRTATASGEFFTQYDPSIALLPSADPAANVATLSVAFKAAEQARQTVTLGEGVFEINAPLTADGGITVVGQGWDKTTLKQVGAGRVITLAGGSMLKGVAVTGGAISAQWQHGAGVYVEYGTVSWCCISNNATARPAGNNNYGGGVGISKGTVDHSIIAYNTSAANGGASYGGGIGVYGPTGPIVIDTCLIVGNKAPNGGGGGIYANSGTVTVRNTTITGNSANTSGGGLVFSGAQLLQNSIVWDNTADKSADVSGTMAAASTGNLIGEDPLFKDAANGDYRLCPDSPAVDIGIWYAGIVEDLDGKKRFHRIDAGCYKVSHGLMLMVK